MAEMVEAGLAFGSTSAERDRMGNDIDRDEFKEKHSQPMTNDVEW